MKAVYFGTSEFAVPSLEAISEDVVLVVTQPDRESGRGLKLTPSAVKRKALELGIEVATPERARAKAFVQRLEDLEPDIFVVASFGQILSQKLLDVPRIGSFNLHASILPQYRGAAPIQYSILNGDQESGVTLMQMNAGMDTGDIVKISRTPIGADETAGELHDRLATFAAELIREEWYSLTTGDYQRTKQVDEEASYAPKFDRSLAELQPTADAASEYNRLRAFTPFPGAWMKTTQGDLKVLKARKGQGSGLPGEILATANGLEVAFAQDSLMFEAVQLKGRRAVSGAEFANGARLTVGDCLI